MSKLIIKRIVEEKKDKSIDVTWIIPRYNQFSSTMFYAALQSSMAHFSTDPDILSKNFSYRLNSANITVKTHFVELRMYIEFVNYLMDNYPDIFYDKDGKLKQDGGML